MLTRFNILNPPQRPLKKGDVVLVLLRELGASVKSSFTLP
jgi:hypothetical protein